MFSSSFPGERSSAGRAADVLLTAAQLSWVDVLPRKIAGRRGLLAALARATSPDPDERADGAAKANGLLKSTGYTWADMFTGKFAAKAVKVTNKPKPSAESRVRARPAPNETLPTRLSLWDQIGFLHVNSSELRDNERTTVDYLIATMAVPWERDIRTIIVRACRRLEKRGFRAPIVTGDRPGYRRTAAQ
jgi:hypothetical protein